MSDIKSKNVINLGCRLNLHESKIISSRLHMANLDNVTLINTCAVTKEAERQSRQAIRKAKRLNPDNVIAITGCASQVNFHSFSKMPEVNFIIDNTCKTDKETYATIANKITDHTIEDQACIHITNDTKQPHNDESQENIDTYKVKAERKDSKLINVAQTVAQTRTYMEDRTRVFVQIQNGCDHRCTFCIIPYGRGDSRSVNIDTIINEIQVLVHNGYQEIVLTGVDITDYGKNLEPNVYLGLLCKQILHKVPSLPRLRLSSVDVAEIDKDLLDLLQSDERFMPYLHISLQSGDDIILKRMKRRHNRQMTIDFCNYCRQIRPDICFGSDIIAGFPTETDQMFQNTSSLLSTCNIIYNHIFTYSERPNTPASRMPQVDHAIRKERTRNLIKQTEEQLANFLQTLIGSKQSVIIEKGGTGKAANFATIQFQNNETKDMNGKIVEMLITGATNTHLLGDIIS